LLFFLNFRKGCSLRKRSRKAKHIYNEYLLFGRINKILPQQHVLQKLCKLMLILHSTLGKGLQFHLVAKLQHWRTLVEYVGLILSLQQLESIELLFVKGVFNQMLLMPVPSVNFSSLFASTSNHSCCKRSLDRADSSESVHSS